MCRYFINNYHVNIKKHINKYIRPVNVNLMDFMLLLLNCICICCCETISAFKSYTKAQSLSSIPNVVKLYTN